MAEPAKMANGLNAEEDVVDPSEIFRFFELPNELKFKILGYIPERDAKTFCKLLRVSKASKLLCESVPFKFERCINEINFRERSIEARIDDGLLGEKAVNLSDIAKPYIRMTARVLTYSELLDDIRAFGVTKMCAVQQIRADHLASGSDVVARTEVFQAFIDVIQAKEWSSAILVQKRLLKGLKVHRVFLVDTDIDDEALLQFHARHLFLANERERAAITDRGLNAYIKQWLAGKRDMRSFELGWDLSRRNVTVILDGLNANPVWTPADHSYSLLGHIPIEDLFAQTQTHGMDQLFTIFPSRNYRDYRILSIGQSCLRIDFPPETEVNLLRRVQENLFPEP